MENYTNNNTYYSLKHFGTYFGFDARKDEVSSCNFSYNVQTKEHDDNKRHSFYKNHVMCHVTKAKLQNVNFSRMTAFAIIAKCFVIRKSYKSNANKVFFILAHPCSLLSRKFSIFCDIISCRS